MPQSAEYREFEPCAALRGYVRAFFTFAMPAHPPRAGRFAARRILLGSNDAVCPALFADGHVSMVFDLAGGSRVAGLWQPPAGGSSGYVIGAMSRGHATSFGRQIDAVGVYFRAAGSRLFTRVPPSELADRIVPLEDLWRRRDARLATALRAAADDGARIDCLEAALLEEHASLSERSRAWAMPAIANRIRERGGAITVERLAEEAGVSRQHLTREFRACVGVTPKLYCRLARFQRALHDLSTSSGAEVAARADYTDQSHMIAEFREFTALTPAMLDRQSRFHPFI